MSKNALITLLVAVSVAACGDFTPPEKKDKGTGKPEVAISKSRPTTPAIGARLVSIGHPDEFMGESFIAVSVDIANNADIPIAAIKGHLDFTTPDGLQKYSLGVDAQGKLDAKSITRLMWKWSSWSGDGINIMKNGLGSYTIIFTPTEIVFVDGSRLTAPDEKTVGQPPKTAT